MEVPEKLNDEFFNWADVGAVIVSNPGYPGFVVAFLLKMVSERVGVGPIEIGNIAARYLTGDDLHLIVKSKGDLLYAAVSTARAGAKRLILSPIED